MHRCPAGLDGRRREPALAWAVTAYEYVPPSSVQPLGEDAFARVTEPARIGKAAAPPESFRATRDRHKADFKLGPPGLKQLSREEVDREATDPASLPVPSDHEPNEKRY
jgi:hypothetical protein